MLERLGGGCFNSSLQYPARVDRTGIRARTPRTMLSQRAAQRNIVALWFGCWRVSHLLRGSDVGAFGEGGDALIIHFKPRRASLFPIWRRASAAQAKVVAQWLQRSRDGSGSGSTALLALVVAAAGQSGRSSAQWRWRQLHSGSCSRSRSCSAGNSGSAAVAAQQ